MTQISLKISFKYYSIIRLNITQNVSRDTGKPSVVCCQKNCISWEIKLENLQTFLQYSRDFHTSLISECNTFIKSSFFIAVSFASVFNI